MLIDISVWFSQKKKYSTQHALIAMIEKAKKTSIKVEHLALF